jgi:DNA-binding NarL/FixJ family response regulator
MLPAPEPLTVVLADDHAPTRAGVREVLTRAGFRVVAEVGDADGAVEATEREQPDVCVLDVYMPGNGIAAATRIAKVRPETAVVMLTVSRDDEDLFASLRAGALGYLLKDTDPERLGHALRGVLAGEAALPRALVARVIDEFRDRGRRRLPVTERGVELTSREWEVLELLRGDLSTAEIAERLFVSQVTVRSHVASVLKKLGVPDRKAALALLNGG